MSKSERLTILVDVKANNNSYTEENQQLIDMHIAELSRLGVEVANVGYAKLNASDNINYPTIQVPDCNTPFGGRDVLILDGNGGVIAGQKGVKINAPLNDVVTATVEFVIGGFVVKSED